jgi:hypothetical protein
VNFLRTRLPWAAPLAVATLHVPLSALWASLSTIGEPLQVAMWKLTAWPLAAAMALITISPVLYFVQKRFHIPRSRAPLLLALGIAAGAGSSFIYTFGLPLPAPLIATAAFAWFVECTAAALLHIAGLALWSNSMRAETSNAA